MEDDLSDLSLLLTPAAHEPGVAAVDHHLAAGRAVLRRRRLAVGTATLVALGAVGVGALAVGQAAPGRTLQDPALPTPSGVPSSPAPTSDPTPGPSRSPGPTRRVADGPDVIGPTRVASAAEVAGMRDFGHPVALADSDADVAVHPDWRVVDRVDVVAPVAVLNRASNPQDIVDAVAVEVVPAAGTPGRRSYLYLDRADGVGSSSSKETIGQLSGSLDWWTTQRVWAGTPRNNGTPGVDVRLLDDGRLAPDEGTEILEERRDADVGGYLRSEQTTPTAEQVRVSDGRVLYVIATRGPSYSGGAPVSLLRRSADHEASYVDQHRRRTARPEARTETLPDPGAVDSAVRDLGEREAPVAALQRLPEMQRKAVVLRHVLGLSVEETAHELDISTGTVKSHPSRARETLRAHLSV